MSMTHYMELLAASQPWNLIIYMVIPVALAEALVAMVFGMVDPTIMGWQPQMDGGMMQHGQHHGQ